MSSQKHIYSNANKVVEKASLSLSLRSTFLYEFDKNLLFVGQSVGGISSCVSMGKAPHDMVVIPFQL
jgi:hypothetical protein